MRPVLNDSSLLSPLLSYDGELRRRGRQLRRTTLGTLRARAEGVPVFVSGFWWDGHHNFGDALTPWLLPRYGIVPILTSASEAAVVGVGSILEMVPSDYAGQIWGGGLMHDAAASFPHARVLAVRGDLTRERLGIGRSIVLGDPGLLIADHIQRGTPTRTLAVVPHGMHTRHPVFQHFASRYRREVVYVDAASSPSRVAHQIARCSAVLTSSLHGLVYADSFGIPAAWVTLDPPLWGGEFKFLDHESVASPRETRRVEFERDTSLPSVMQSVRRANRDRVLHAKDALTVSIRDIATSGQPFWSLARQKFQPEIGGERG